MSDAFKVFQPGEIVDVVAPASKCPKPDLQAGLELIRSWGLVPRVDKALFGKDRFCANSDQQRARQLTAALKAKDSRLVWCVRGGYGSGRILSDVFRRSFPSNKLFIGFSDLTAVQLQLYQQGWASIHGPMIGGLGSGFYSKPVINELKRLLFKPNVSQQFSLKPVGAIRSGAIKGRVVGGNLKMIESLTGTRWLPSFRSQIVFFEDIDERGYSVDRMLDHLLQVGAFKGARAVVFGRFLAGLEKDGKARQNEAISRFAERIKIPVFKGLKVGHGGSDRPLVTNQVGHISGRHQNFHLDISVRDH